MRRALDMAEAEKLRKRPTRRPLPPQPRQALPGDGSTRAGPGTPDRRHDDVPRDGHAVLAGEGGGGDEGVGMRDGEEGQ
jgi:hypothetical protein